MLLVSRRQREFDGSPGDRQVHALAMVVTPLLLGLGMDELSAGAAIVPRVKNAVQRLMISECRQLAEEVLKLDTPAAVLARCTEMAEQNYPDLLG